MQIQFFFYYYAIRNFQKFDSKVSTDFHGPLHLTHLVDLLMDQNFENWCIENVRQELVSPKKSRLRLIVSKLNCS